MQYFKKYKEAGAETVEISKEEARSLLTGSWDESSLEHIFDNDLMFSLYTPYSYIWTEKDGQVLIAGFYGYSE